jgi:hypothetical protein
MTDPISPPRQLVHVVISLILLGSATVVLTSFLVYQTISERQGLRETFAAQEQPLRQARQVRQQFDALVKATARLADDGDVGAKKILDEMKSQGIKVPQ